ncbi:CAI-1 autoinducer sensor kinase/phosphatase CqsS domain protein [Vibrio cholerae]|nr:CAI-1 autoinducer sensor kinase/phosphatase CqsS domain protein [Vibrio cholerae]
MAAVYAGLFSIHHRFLLTLFLRFYDVNERLVDNLGHVVYGVHFSAYSLSARYESDGVTSSFLRVGGLSCGIWFDGFSPDDFD